MGKRKRSRRANGEGKFWHEGKLYRWRWYYTDPLTGKKRTKNLSAPTQAELNKEISVFRRSLEQDSGEYQDMTLQQWLNQWLETKKATKKAKTSIGYEGICRNHIIPVMGDWLITRVRQPHVQRFLDGISQKYSPTTVASVRRVFRAAMNAAIDAGIIKSNPVIRTETPKIPKRLPVSMEPEVMKEMFRLAYTGEFLPPVNSESMAYLRREYFVSLILAIITGMRSGELFGLTWPCIGDDGVIKIERTAEYVKGGPRFSSTKTLDSVRYVRIPAPIVGLLSRWRKIQEEYAALFEGYYDNVDGLVLTNSVGHFVDRQNMFKRWWKPLRIAVGLPQFKWKDLRSAAITYYASHGVETRTVGAMAGHTDVRTTLLFYTGVTSQQEKYRLEVADEMARELLPRLSEKKL